MPPIHSPSVVREIWKSQDNLHRLFCGDSKDVLRSLPSQSIHCAVTSPPYWGLRDYGGSNLEIGVEHSISRYVDNLVDTFRELKRVLRSDGTFWLNIGDSYDKLSNSKEVNGLPWKVAFALQKDGWLLRQDIIWSKTNPMPDSVKDRCVRSFEYVFLFVKNKKYYFDSEAIKTEAISKKYDKAARRSVWYEEEEAPGVWTTAKGNHPGAHYAVFPPELVEPMILAGTSEGGCCSKCLSPMIRIVKKEGGDEQQTQVEGRDRSYKWSRNGVNSKLDSKVVAKTITLGWKRSCSGHPYIITPCTVLDPFCGSGTANKVAMDLGRASIGIDLSETYLRQDAIPRLKGIP